MVYLNNTTENQELFIPRQDKINVDKTGIDLSAYLTSGETIELINEKVEETVSAATADFITSGQAQDMIDDSISGIPTEFKTVNGESVVGTGNIQITVPTKTSDLTNDSGYITSAQTDTKIADAIAAETARTESTYLKEHQSLSAYSTTEQMNQAISAATDDMATKTWVGQQGYLTEHQSLDNYYTKSEVDTKISEIDVSDQLQPIKDDITDLKAADITINQTLSQKADKSEIPTVPTSNTAFTNDAGYVTSGEVETQIMGKNYTTSAETQTQINNSLSGYATEQWVEGKNYLTEHQSLAGLVAGAQYVSADQEIIFTDKSGTTVATIDASDFIKDGMVSNVEIVNGNLVISFNTDAGKENITIPLTDIFNPANYYTKTEIDNKGYLNTVQTQSLIDSSLSGYATEQWVEGKGYLTQHQSLDNYYTSAQTDTQIADAIASETARTESTYLKEHQSLSAYSTTVQVQDMIDDSISGIPTEFKTINNQSVIGSGNIQITVPTATSDLTNDSGFITSADTADFVTSAETQTQINNSLSGYATEQWVENKGYLTQHQSLDNYYTSAQTDTKIAEVKTDIATISGKVQTDEEVTAVALNKLRTDIDSIIIPDVSEFVTSGEVQTQIDDSISGIPTEFKTINNQSIVGSGNITIESGGNYSAGTNIDITNNVISVTGITVPTATSDLTNDSGFITSADTENFVTSGEVQTQIDTSLSGYATEQWVEGKGYLTEHQSLADYYTSAQTDTQIANAIASETARTESTYLKEHQSLSAYSTTVQVQDMIDTSLSGKQDTLISGTNIKTINNQSILGSGNITIQGGSGGGGETVVELTKAQYEALSGYDADTTYIITDADSVDLNDFATSGQVSELSALTTDLSTNKADKVNVSANSGNYRFPNWNNQGVITGYSSTLSQYSMTVNGSTRYVTNFGYGSWGNLYAPTTAGEKNAVLLSNGSGAPVWSQIKMQFISQSAYDAITTKDANTIYFIISEN